MQIFEVADARHGQLFDKAEATDNVVGAMWNIEYTTAGN
jgi:hypothetical protein